MPTETCIFGEGREALCLKSKMAGISPSGQRLDAMGVSNGESRTNLRNGCKAWRKKEELQPLLGLANSMKEYSPETAGVLSLNPRYFRHP